MELSRAISALVGAAVGLTAGYALWGSGDAHRALDRQVARLEAVGQQFSRLDQERRLAVASCAQSSLSPNRTANVAPPSGTVQQLAGGAPSGSNGASTIVRAHRLIEEALRAHRWTTEDSSSLRQLIAGLNVEQQLDVVTSVARAINAGQLEWNGRGPPF
ncbi:MAG TPA: hypothetical protein VG937_06655 [Polyangiaceae bacterium]|jgi:hypothetical protein|nr:hypothetical protein [Polyangiaceae bacterium]